MLHEIVKQFGTGHDYRGYYFGSSQPVYGSRFDLENRRSIDPTSIVKSDDKEQEAKSMLDRVLREAKETYREHFGVPVTHYWIIDKRKMDSAYVYTGYDMPASIHDLFYYWKSASGQLQVDFEGNITLASMDEKWNNRDYRIVLLDRAFYEACRKKKTPPHMQLYEEHTNRHVKASWTKGLISPPRATQEEIDRELGQFW